MSSGRLLIIDDEPDICYIIRQVAVECDFQVEITTTSDAFKNTYAAFAPTGIVLDLAIPGADGIELLRWLADVNCGAPIAILSGFDDKVIESAKLLGAARGLTMRGILSKPMGTATIRKVLTNLRKAASS